MGKIWDDINRLVDDTFGGQGATPPSATDAAGFIDGVPTGDIQGSVSPDALKQDLLDQGYVSPERTNPFTTPTSDIFGVTADQPNPFTTVDLNPMQDGGTRGAIGGAGKVLSNQYPAQQATLDKIAKLLNCPAMALINVANGIFRQGVTYQLPLSGNFLRVDRLPPGFYGVSSVNNLVNQTINTQLVSNDVYAQSVLSVTLSGVFIQFGSLDAPIMMGQHGSTFDGPFNSVFITTFGSAGRWRITTANKARLGGPDTDRTLRSQLHLWDGGGILDAMNFHPVPFSATTGRVTTGDPALGGDNNGGAAILSNYDDGTGLVTQASGNVVGTVGNKGYVVAWITSINIIMRVATANDLQGFFYLQKFRQPLHAATFSALPLSGQTTSMNPLFSDAFNYTKAGTIQEFVRVYNLTIPIRVVLAGFDMWVAGSNDSGETLYAWMDCARGKGPQDFQVTMQGYYLGNASGGGVGGRSPIIPFNPYPGDVIIPVQ